MKSNIYVRYAGKKRVFSFLNYLFIRLWFCWKRYILIFNFIEILKINPFIPYKKIFLFCLAIYPAWLCYTRFCKVALLEKKIFWWLNTGNSEDIPKLWKIKHFRFYCLQVVLIEIFQTTESIDKHYDHESLE